MGFECDQTLRERGEWFKRDQKRGSGRWRRCFLSSDAVTTVTTRAPVLPEATGPFVVHPRLGHYHAY